jgi:hypothetical protein
LKLKLNSFKDRSDRPPHTFNVQRLKSTEKAEEFRCEIKNKFEAMTDLKEEDINDHWTKHCEISKSA